MAPNNTNIEVLTSLDDLINNGCTTEPPKEAQPKEETSSEEEKGPTPAELRALRKKRAVMLKGTTLGSLPVVYPEKDSWYSLSVIPKKSGGKRIIEAPVEWLKTAQKKIYEDVLLKYCPVSEHAFGCIKNRNTTLASEPHVGKKIILKLDLKDCFHNITVEKIEKALVFSGLPNTLAVSIAYYCTNSRGVLPQGSPASASLANIYMIKMYAALNKMSTAMGLQFSGYLDDLVISGVDAWKAYKAAVSIINTYGFIVSPEKVSIMRRKKEVLGICVAAGKDHTRLPAKTRRSIRGFLHNIRLKAESKEKIPEADVMKLSGFVAYAEAVRDQKAELFKKQLTEIRRLIGE